MPRPHTAPTRPRRAFAALTVLTVCALFAGDATSTAATRRTKASRKSPTAAPKAAPKAAAGVAGAATAIASVNTALATDVTGGRPITRQGSVASLASTTVSVGGAREISIGALADEALGAARTAHGQVNAARAGLFADAVLTEEVAETSEATIFTAHSNFTVVDRNAVSAQVPQLRRFRPKNVRLNQLTASQRRAFDEYKRSLDNKPNGHPLKQAAAQSDQALLDALGQGQADVSLVTTVRVEKVATPQSGKFALPVAGQQIPAGARAQTTPAINTPTAINQNQNNQNNQNRSNQGTASGEANHTAKFLTGWSLGDAMHWSERIDFGFAWVEIGLHAGYTFGLRIPVEMKGTMTPSQINRQGSGQFADTYEVSVHDVAAIDADVDHYRVTGLDADKRASGKELAFEAGAYAFVKGRILGADFNERFPKNLGFDFGEHFRPPYGDCGVDCGLNFYLPSSVTKTGINVLGIVRGEALLGLNVGGDGAVNYDYESLVRGEVVPSTRVNSGETALVHHISTDGRTGTTARFRTELPESALGNVSFGYRLSNPTYDWTVKLTPIVKALATFDYVIGEADIELGPYPLPISVTLGTIHLPTHAGTQASSDKVDGKLITDLRAGSATGAPDVSAVQGDRAIDTDTNTKNTKRGKAKGGKRTKKSATVNSLAGERAGVAATGTATANSGATKATKATKAKKAKKAKRNQA